MAIRTARRRLGDPLTGLMYCPLRNVCARMMATTEGGVTLYNLAQRQQIAPGTDQVGAVWAISAETGNTAWVYEQRAGTTSLITGGGLYGVNHLSYLAILVHGALFPSTFITSGEMHGTRSWSNICRFAQCFLRRPDQPAEACSGDTRRRRPA